MLLTIDPATGVFVAEGAGEEQFRALIEEHGWGQAPSWRTQPAAYTRCEYAALALWDHADTVAQDVLFVRRMEQQESYAEGAPDVYPAPPGLRYAPFQRAGIRYALARPHVLIGDEVGLGKTIQAVGVANAMGAERVLVVCPAALRLQWQRMVRAWTMMRRPRTYPILRAADGVSPFADWTFISYNLVTNPTLLEALVHNKYDLLILDEAHYLKTTDARRTRAVFGRLRDAAPSLVGRSGKILALTGTPLPNRPRECYNLARHLCPEAVDFVSEDAFQRRYNPSFKWPSGHVEERKGRLPELRNRLRCNFMVRRLKRRVMPQLPRAMLELTYIEPNGAIRRVLKAERLIDFDPEHLELTDPEIWGHIATVRREMGEAKVPRVLEHVLTLFDGGLRKLFLIAYHRSVITPLAERLARFGVAVIDGRTSPVQKDRRVGQFVREPATRILLGQIETAGTGLDGMQQVCSHVVFAEASWVPKDNEQAIGRLDRWGQRESVLAQFLVAPGGLDEMMLGRAIEKAGAIHEVLDGGE